MPKVYPLRIKTVISPLLKGHLSSTAHLLEFLNHGRTEKATIQPMLSPISRVALEINTEHDSQATGNSQCGMAKEHTGLFVPH